MKVREIAAAIVIDVSGHFLLQQRDNIPEILYPGMVGLFGGHREGDETFLECAVRELHEELTYAISPARFEHLWSYNGPDWTNTKQLLRAEYFVVRDIPGDQVKVTEGSLLVVDPADWTALIAKMTPGLLQVMDVFSKKHFV